MADNLTLFGIVIGSAGTLVTALLVYMSARHRASIDAAIASDRVRADSVAARERIASEATSAREKILAEATTALQSQQSRYIADLQSQADNVSRRLTEVDTKLQAAQMAILTGLNEKLDLKVQLQAASADLDKVRSQLDEALRDLVEARAINRDLQLRLEAFQATQGLAPTAY